MKRRGWSLSLLMGCLAGPALAMSTIPMQGTVTQSERPWSEVQDIQKRAAAARLAPYDSYMGRWMLAPDGRYAIVQEASEEYDSPAQAMLGRYVVNGNWLELRVDGASTDLDGMTPEARAQYEAWHEELQADAEAAIDDVESESESTETDDVVIDEEAVESGSDAAQVDPSLQRYLRLPYRGGELLLREESLAMTATSWKGEGPMEVTAQAWRVPGFTRDPEDYSFEFSIDDPLHANLPWELARLLRPDAIEARVTEVRETHEDLKWEHQSAEVHLRLDRGEKHGLYSEMSVYGLPPDEGVYGRIVEVQPEYAIAQVDVERFSPREQPSLPGVGLRMTTRPAKGGACPLDFSAALRGSVLSVATPADQLAWDKEGYAWFELSLDQGGMHGLSVGDRLYAEDDKIRGEGRVASAESERSVVLWRVQRYGEDDEIAVPQRDSKLVTPAWKRAEWDVFGATPALEKAAVSE